ncbi:HNH endonuclease [Streptomyces sp. NPDC014864]|uniref:HNH endonuclease n=1 Tax=Streptomyces sp. NPDC014864 TaxID=3364924 RepID=UPI0036FD393E
MTFSLSGVRPTDLAQLYVRTRRRRAAPYNRRDVFARWGGLCCYCDAPAEHLDHVQPLSRGGRDVLSNVVPACADCNLGKAALTLAEWAGNRLASTASKTPTEEKTK